MPFTPRYPEKSFSNRVLREIKPNEVITFKQQKFKASDSLLEVLTNALGMEQKVALSEKLRAQYRVINDWAKNDTLVRGSEPWPGVFVGQPLDLELPPTIITQLDSYLHLCYPQAQYTILEVRHNNGYKHTHTHTHTYCT